MAEQKASTARRDKLISNEQQVQKSWEEGQVFQPDADEKKEKYFVTFPYPYMNGALHLGHAFTLCKSEFASRYQRMKGKNVLFPFAYHCTGMPIAACADRLKREVAEYGCPPDFPETSGDGDEKEKSGAEEGKEEKKAEKKEEKKAEKKEEKAGKGKVAKKKSKFLHQWDILREMGVPEADIPKFQDPKHWLMHFTPIAEEDLKAFGCCIDFRRSFITTDANPFYDSFIRWHFNTLKRRGKIAFGSRLSVFSPRDNQPCADHDRATGEGVGVQEYTGIKMQLIPPYPSALKAIVDRKEHKARSVFLPAATLRPETMYGQTNCFVLPTGDYGVFVINDTDIFVCSDRAALNMSYQEMGPVRGQPQKIGSVRGDVLLGCAVRAPLAKYDRVFVLPLLTIKMNKGTGVVTSVPSDAPDDYAALMDMKNKPKLRQKYGITDEMVLPFDVVPIIETPGLGMKPAADLCEQRGVKSQNDKELLEAIKQECYLSSFYKGIMRVGPFSGQKVSEAKPLIKQLMVDNKQAFTYAEPESPVMSRSGVECVVALTDQWYLKYGQDDWKAPVAEHVSNTLETFNPVAKRCFEDAVGWLHEWACSRTYGLGTRLPWDKKWVIESLSDSTVYMAYYTIAHMLQGGVVDGSKPGPARVQASQLTDAVYNYIFLKSEFPTYPKSCGIAKKTLDAARREFEYWYPVDLRVSGKDLIGNHLTMAIYNHAAVWEGDSKKLPRAFFTNGHLMINGEKMSKSTGNFLTMRQAIQLYGSDATRFALADAGDGLDDANFDDRTANAIILRLTAELEWVNEVVAGLDELRSGPPSTFLDRMFANEMNHALAAMTAAMDRMHYRSAIAVGVHGLINARDFYRTASVDPMNRELIERYLESFAVAISPFTPHFSEMMWKTLGKEGLLYTHAKWPEAEPVDPVIFRQGRYLREVSHSARAQLTKKKNDNKKKRVTEDMNAMTIHVAGDFPVWQQKAMACIRGIHQQSGAFPDAKVVVAELSRAVPELSANKRRLQTAMLFFAEVKERVEKEDGSGDDDPFETKLPFDELKFLQDHQSFIVRDCAGIAHATIEAVDNDENDGERENGDGGGDGSGEASSQRRNVERALPGKPSFTFTSRNGM